MITETNPKKDYLQTSLNSSGNKISTGQKDGT
jgi:hypothetical protein